MAGKTHAPLCRRYAKGRDLFDLSWCLTRPVRPSPNFDLLGNALAQPRFFHFRTAEGHEVDLVLEEASGRIVGVEVKAAATVGEKDFRGLRVLAQAAGRRFRRGVLPYTGTQIVPFGANLHAVPLEALWRWRSSSRG